MSIKEVIDRAAELGGWKIGKSEVFRGPIRRDDGSGGEQCPLSSLIDRHACFYQDACDTLRITTNQGYLVAAAADGDDDEKAAHIRRYMLKKFNLQEAR